jgi:hypothetical protein
MPAVPAGRVPRPSGAPFEESKIAMNHRLLRCLVALSALAGFGSPALAEGDVFRYPEDTRPAFAAALLRRGHDARCGWSSCSSIPSSSSTNAVTSTSALATSWKVDDDQMGISFVLREGVKWHDGQPFTADDVVFTMRAARDPKTIFNAKSKYSFIKEADGPGPVRGQGHLQRPSRARAPVLVQGHPEARLRRERPSAARTSSPASPSAPARSASRRAASASAASRSSRTRLLDAGQGRRGVRCSTRRTRRPRSTCCSTPA